MSEEGEETGERERGELHEKGVFELAPVFFFFIPIRTGFTTSVQGAFKSWHHVENPRFGEESITSFSSILEGCVSDTSIQFSSAMTVCTMGPENRRQSIKAQIS